MKIIKKYNQIIKVPLEGVRISSKDSEKIRPEMKDRIERILITRRLIKNRIRMLAKEISDFYKDQPRIEMLFILEGASVFAYALAQEIYNISCMEIRIQSIKAKTYGDELKENGEVKRPVRIFYMPTQLENKKVLLVEDIIDQGFTLYAIKEKLLNESKVSEIRICALLDKRLKNPSREVQRIRASLQLDWVGFSIPDRWVAGYGIDAGEDFRFLPFIVIVKEGYYLKGEKL